MLLYEFPERYVCVSENSPGTVDEISWLTHEAVGEKGTPVPSGAVIHVRGWAPNLAGDGPATCVVLLIDGVEKHQARVGIGRADVARHYQNDAFVPSGFEAIVTTGRLAPGEHEISACTVDPQTMQYARVLLTMSFTVVADWTVLPAAIAGDTPPCAGSLDEIVDESRGFPLTVTGASVAVPRGSLLALRGWFLDPAAGVAFAQAYAIIDGDRSYPVAYGAPRPDVASTFSGLPSPNVGFDVRVPTSALTRGLHRLEIFGMSPDGERLVPTPIALQLIVGQASPARFVLPEMAPAFLDDVTRVQGDAARSAVAPLRVLRGDRLFVRGWAFDEAARTVAAGVVLLIDGDSEISALYGLPRPDIAVAFNNDELVRSGFTGEIETAGLAAGMHAVECRVLASDGRGAYATAQRFDFEVSEV